MSLEDPLALRRKKIRMNTIERAMNRWPSTRRGMLALQKKRRELRSDYGNNIRAQAQKAGIKNAFDIPGFVPESFGRCFCEGRGPFRWSP